MPESGVNIKQKSHFFFSSLIITCLITSGLILGNLLVERTAPGRWLEFNTYELLHSVMSPFSQEKLSVVVVDITKLPGGHNGPTSRKTLRQLVEAIADQKPAAIGVDIDFSPDENGAMTVSDEEDFFNPCELIRKGKRADGRHTIPVPVFLAIDRTLYDPPDNWLPYSEYRDMAVGIRIQAADTRRMPRWFAGPTYGGEGGEFPFLRSMGEALAEEYSRAHDIPMPTPPGWMRAAVQRIPLAPDKTESLMVGGEECKLKDGLNAGMSLVNMSKLEEIHREVLPMISAEAIRNAGEKFAGRMVIIGDAEVQDSFSVPGPVLPVQGVLLHACAAYTFAQAPLYEFLPVTRALLDVVLSVILFSMFQLFPAHTISHRRIRRRTHAFIMLGVIIASALLVYWFGILWLDFILITFALAIHPALEERFHHDGAGTRTTKKHSSIIPLDPHAPVSMPDKEPS